MDPNSLTQSAVNLANQAADLAAKAAALAQQSTMAAAQTTGGGDIDILTMGLTVFVLACFVGYYVVWRVTPALHSPLMAVTNAISSVIVVGALLAAGTSQVKFSETTGLIAVGLASINIFGGFVVTQRMLGKFKKKGAK